MPGIARPYIGINGFRTAEEVDDAVATLRADGWNGDRTHDAAIGFAVDERTLRGETPASPRKVTDFPALLALAGRVHADLLGVVHYDCRDYAVSTDGATTVAEVQRGYKPLATDLSRALGTLSRETPCHTVQLNGVPDPAEVRALKQRVPDLDIIYQVRPDLCRLGDDIVLEHIGACASSLAHVLYDPSRGRGEAFASDEAIRMHRLISRAFPHLTFGVAGGFSPENLAERHEAIRAGIGHRLFSVDAESRVRDPGTDALNPDRVRAFYRQGRLVTERD